MFFKKKKFYTLLDIKNKIIYTPLIFVLILSIISFISIFLFLEYEKKNRIKIRLFKMKIFIKTMF